MKHYFFVNPMAGQGKGIDKLIEEIKTTAAELQEEAIICLTESVEDGITKAREAAEKLNGEPAREEVEQALAAQVQMNRRLLQQVLELDKTLSLKVAREKSFYQ